MRRVISRILYLLKKEDDGHLSSPEISHWVWRATCSRQAEFALAPWQGLPRHLVAERRRS